MQSKTIGEVNYYSCFAIVVLAQTPEYFEWESEKEIVFLRNKCEDIKKLLGEKCEAHINT